MVKGTLDKWFIIIKIFIINIPYLLKEEGLYNDEW